MCMILSVFFSEKGMKNSGLNGDLNPDVCNAGAVLYQLSYLANLELVFTTSVLKQLDVFIKVDCQSDTSLPV